MKKMSKNRYVVLGVVLMFAFFASSFFLSPSKNIENIASASVLDSIVNFFTGSSNCSPSRPLPEGSNVDIDDTDNTVTVSIPYDGNPSLCFAPEIQTFYSKTIVTPASGEAQDFTNPVTYTVNQDGLVKTYVVTFIYNSFPVTYIAGAHGSIIGSTNQIVSLGEDGSTVTAFADPGYHFTSWSDGSTTMSRTDKNVVANLSVTANFEVNEYNSLVSGCLDLQNLRDNLSSTYTLQNDIDCSDSTIWNNGQGFIPIGNGSTPFTGTINGNGYKIIGLYINSTSTDNVGLFGVTSDATINNVKIEEGSILGRSYVGGLIGNSQNNTNITNSYFSGTVTGSGSYIGGLVGNMEGTIGYSHFSGTINNPGTKTHTNCTGLCSSDNQWVGGLAGRSGGTIYKSYFDGTLTSFAMNVGGLAGYAQNISNSYAIGNIRGMNNVGGLASSATTVTNSYSKVNIIWTRDARVSCSYYGTCVLGGILGTGNGSSIDRVFTEAYMDFAGLNIDVYALAGYGKYVAIRDSSFLFRYDQGASNHLGSVRVNIVRAPNSEFFKNIANLPLNLWDFENVWNIDPNINNGYPYLRPYSTDPFLSFTSSISTLLEGNTATLTWTPANTTSCTADGNDSDWAGSSLSASDVPHTWTTRPLTAGTHTYSISCAGYNGDTTSASVTITATPIISTSVTFDSQSATVPASPTTKIVVPPATTVVTLPTTPAKTGYTFGGWYTAINGGGTAFTATTPVTANITVYAKWTVNPIYNVTFDSQSATAPANPTTKTVTIPVTTVVTLPTAPTKTGLTFGGWFTAVNGGGTEFTATTSVSADITVYAKWLTFAGGNGTASNPYQISNWTQLNNVRNYLDKNFILTTNLSSATVGYAGVGDNWEPISPWCRSCSFFAGAFNGNGKTISDLVINKPGVSNVGLFGMNEGGISNLGLINANVTGGNFVGGLAGASWYGGNINNSYSTGKVNGGKNVGGLVGYFSSTMNNSYSTAQVTAISIAGYSASTGAGGLVGGNNGTINNSYSTGKVVGILDVGGLVGECGLGKVLNSFWDTQTSGKATSGCGVGTVGKTTAEMKTPSTFATWDTSKWNFVEGFYPALKWQTIVTLSTPASTIVEGNTATLTWTPANVTSCTADGNDLDWAGSSLSASGVPHTWITRPLTAGTRTYGVSCTGSAGEIASASIAIIVTPISSLVTFDSQSATVSASPTTKTVTAPATTVVTLPTAPTKTGYTFGGWYTAINGRGTKFTAATPVTAAITVYAKWIDITEDPCEAYDAEAGTKCTDGTVYVSSTLRTTPSDAGGYQWGPAPAVTNATDMADGRNNITTLKVLSSNLSVYPAAQACENSTANGKDDWYLPAKNELDTLYDNRVAIGNFNTSGSWPGSYYWSSTEYNSDWAYYRMFSQLFPQMLKYYAGVSVRCVRRPGVGEVVTTPVTLNTSASTAI